MDRDHLNRYPFTRRPFRWTKSVSVMNRVLMQRELGTCYACLDFAWRFNGQWSNLKVKRLIVVFGFHNLLEH